MLKQLNGVEICIQKDQFNSEIFDRLMGNLEFKIAPAATADEVQLADYLQNSLAKATQEGYRHLSCRVDTDCKCAIHTLENCGFRLVDTLVTYCFDFAKSKLTPVTHRCELGDCREEDIEVLKAIAKKSYLIDRFHSDSSLPNELCDHYYEQWIENSCRGFADKVEVAYLNGHPVGFSTAKYTPGEEYVHIVLNAVSEDARGAGIYTSMEYEVMQWAFALKQKTPFIKGVLLGTQIDNLGSHKTCIKLGFTVHSSKYVFQRSLND